jgi:hypothetical protein
MTVLDLIRAAKAMPVTQERIDAMLEVVRECEARYAESEARREYRGD